MGIGLSGAARQGAFSGVRGRPGAGIRRGERHLLARRLQHGGPPGRGGGRRGESTLTVQTATAVYSGLTAEQVIDKDPAASDEDARRWIAQFGGDEIQTLIAAAAGRVLHTTLTPLGQPASVRRTARDLDELVGSLHEGLLETAAERDRPARAKRRRAPGAARALRRARRARRGTRPRRHGPWCPSPTAVAPRPVRRNAARPMMEPMNACLAWPRSFKFRAGGREPDTSAACSSSAPIKPVKNPRARV